MPVRKARENRRVLRKGVEGGKGQLSSS